MNSQRSGFVVNADGSIEERSGRYFNTDLRVQKRFSSGTGRSRVYADFYNVFNTENLSFTPRPEQSSAASARHSCSPCASTAPGSARPSAGRSRHRSAPASSSSLEATEGCGGNGSTRRNGETDFLTNEILRCSASP